MEPSKTQAFRQAAEQAAQARSVEQILKAKLKLVESERDRLQSQLNIIESLEDHKSPSAPRWLTPKSPAKGHRATLNLMLTDTHFDEVVDPAQIDGLNAYNREIAEIRLERWAKGAVKLSKHYLSGVKYDGVCLMLGGDIFSGNIHEELARTNEDTLFGSLLYWLDPMRSALELLAREFDRVHVAGTPGNHGRMTRKPIAKQRAADNLDWLLYRLLHRELARDDRFTWQIPTSADTRVSVYNCVAPETRLLTADLQWMRAGDVTEGQKLLGFDEHLAEEGSGRGRTRRWREATALSSGIDSRETVRIILESGEEIVCTPDHRWLCGTSYGFANKWVRSDQIRPGWSLRRWFRPWEEDRSHGAGWLAGILDGEGSLGNRAAKSSAVSPDGRSGVQPSIAQNEGVVAERVRRELALRGFAHTEDQSRPCKRFVLRGGFPEAARLFGTVRPVRLLEGWQSFVRDLAPHMHALGNERVVKVESAGTRDIVVLGTDTETYIAEGFGSHNTRYLLTHGDQFRGGSGISGAMSPLFLGQARKSRRQQLAGKPYDYMVIGHWHTSMPPHRGMIMGGAMKGADEYSYIGNFDYEPPQQPLWITTPERGITFNAPVMVCDRKQEGW